MTKKRRMRIGFYLIEAALCAALTILMNITADARARHHHTAQSTHFAPAKTSTPGSNQNGLHGAQKLEEHNAPNPETAPEKAGDDKQPGRRSVGAEQGGNKGTAGNADAITGAKETKLPEMKDLGPVDTHITVVPPRLQGGKVEITRQGSSKIKSKSSKYFHARSAFVRHKNNSVVRNTIGVPVAPHSVTVGQHGVPAGAWTVDKAGTAMGVGRAGAGVGSAGTFHPIAGTGRSGPFANYGTIGGSSFPRRGYVPASLGGQTKMTGALSGSMVRPKY
jgi:hypothetical protein